MSTHVPIILAVSVTDRSASMRRMLRSLEPARHDAALHLVVLDNSVRTEERQALASAIDDWSRQSAGISLLVHACQPGAPLHRSRQRVTELVAEFFDEHHLDTSSPHAIWMLDDDLTFERLVRHHDTLALENTALHHLEAARTWARAHPDAVFIGDVTGDPPVRPEAIIATQLLDLTFNLDIMRRSDPDQLWAAHGTGTWRGDYYYDHAEQGEQQLHERYAWLPRGDRPARVRDCLRAMLDASCHIASGSTPFRPKIATCGSPEMSPTRTPLRGGNAIFTSLDAVTAHTYPSVKLAHGWSRRADMIGSTLLARRGRYDFFSTSLSLHHDRTGQAPLSQDMGRWAAEFYGVLFARLFMTSPPHGRSCRAHLDVLARGRFERIIARLDTAKSSAQQARAELCDERAWWWRDRELTALSTRLDARLAHIELTIDGLCTEQLRDALLDPQHLAEVYHRYLMYRDEHRRDGYSRRVG